MILYNLWDKIQKEKQTRIEISKSNFVWNIDFVCSATQRFFFTFFGFSSAGDENSHLPDPQFADSGTASVAIQQGIVPGSYPTWATGEDNGSRLFDSLDSADASLKKDKRCFGMTLILYRVT